MRPVADINFHIGSKTYRFTARWLDLDDVPKLMLLFMALTQPQGTFDVETYMRENTLWRYFSEAT